ncbi:RNA polymerase sigma factor [Actinomadura atramentaria]|uniref:RNA polymerase sigma factor n=1 Tax=Actinomadura atramentaria TaxID=1990 RepID=UPI0003A1FCAD|nr:sigma-70 family RNA polymerase sigma factor [Actinomadura atramentaria]
MTGEQRFEAAVRRDGPALLGYLTRRTDAPEDAADLLAEVFATAWRRVADLPPGDEARLWLYGIARRTLANHRRGRVRRHRLAARLREHLAARADGGDDPDDRVRDALRALSDRDREVLTLTAWEQMTPAEIAVVLDLDPGTVRARLSRARARLRAALEKADARAG